MITCGIDSVSDEQLPEQVLVPGDSFFERTYTALEQELAGAARNRFEFLRGRFAAKEAVFKALGMDPDALGRWSAIEIAADEHGSPQVRLHATAAEHTSGWGITSLSVSITHDQNRHLAMCVAEVHDGKELA